jgi:hypothetical protein
MRLNFIVLPSEILPYFLRLARISLEIRSAVLPITKLSYLNPNPVADIRHTIK